jgi:predicted GTPase
MGWDGGNKNAIDADLVLSATPIALDRLFELNKPITRVRYELSEAGGIPLSVAIEPIVGMTRVPALPAR